MRALPPGRVVADQAFSRAAGAPLVDGNHVRLLRDAAENYPAWLDAIAPPSAGSTSRATSSTTTSSGAVRRGADRAARAGVEVRRHLRLARRADAAGRRCSGTGCATAGVEVRAFNPPRSIPGRSAGWRAITARSLAVDGRVGFVIGPVRRRHVGGRGRRRDPWRDTGVEMRGPGGRRHRRRSPRCGRAAARRCPPTNCRRPTALARAGTVALRVIATKPATRGHVPARLSSSPASRAARCGSPTPTSSGVAATCRRSSRGRDDGVDVRLLVPGGSDLPLVQPLSRAGYRPLLEAGVRIFEWNGTMIHAKTAVADGRWARVGSTQPQPPELAGQLGARRRDRRRPTSAREMERMSRPTSERDRDRADRPTA